jgi:hypothetical protein
VRQVVRQKRPVAGSSLQQEIFFGKIRSTLIEGKGFAKKLPAYRRIFYFSGKRYEVLLTMNG